MFRLGARHAFSLQQAFEDNLLKLSDGRGVGFKKSHVSWMAQVKRNQPSAFVMFDCMLRGDCSMGDRL
jgi:hypothetical protein